LSKFGRRGAGRELFTDLRPVIPDPTIPLETQGPCQSTCLSPGRLILPGGARALPHAGSARLQAARRHCGKRRRRSACRSGRRPSRRASRRRLLYRAPGEARRRRRSR